MTTNILLALLLAFYVAIGFASFLVFFWDIKNDKDLSVLEKSIILFLIFFLWPIAALIRESGRLKK